jgi:hypothetical protein
MVHSVTDQWVRWPDGSVSRPPIDLAEPEPGPVTGALEVHGRLLPAHTRHGDPDSPVLLFLADAVEPGGVFFADLRCRSCTAHSSFGTWDGDTLFLIEHQPGCTTFARLLVKAGER